jgi:hypothetical protein
MAIGDEVGLPDSSTAHRQSLEIDPSRHFLRRSDMSDFGGLNVYQQNRVQTDSNNGFTDENALSSVVLKPFIATIIATLMPAARSAHLILPRARWSELE